MICRVIAEKDIKKAQTKINGFCEWRLDYLSDIDLEKIKAVMTKEIIVTLRPVSCGGKFADEKERIHYLKEIIALHPYCIDIEMETKNLSSLSELAREHGVKLILSHHNFICTPDLKELHALLQKSQQYYPYITKIITTATTLQDNLTILKFNLEAQSKIVSFCMGNLGKLSRIFSPYFGSEFTYTGNVAPGQLSFQDLETCFEIIGDIHDQC